MSISLRRRCVPALALALALTAIGGSLTPGARAGTYAVKACDAAGTTGDSWSWYADWPLDVQAVCPTGGGDWNGIVPRTRVNLGTAGFMSRAGIRFDAPAGASLSQMSVAYRLSRADQAYHVGFAHDRGWVPGASCRANDGVWCDLIGTGINPLSPSTIPLDSRHVRLEVQCANWTGCSTASSGSWPYFRAAARLYSATVWVADGTTPDLSVGGQLWAGGWLKGSVAATYSASDNVGIRYTRAIVDGRGEPFDERSCEFHHVVPCSNISGWAYTLRTADLSDGPHTVTVEVADSAQNTASQTRTILVDNHAPDRPGLINMSGEGWSSANSFDLRVTNPVQRDGAAPISRAHVTLCKVEPAGTCQTFARELAGQGSGEVNTLSGVYVAQGPGDYTAKVHLEDAAGNVSGSSASDPVHLRFDDRAPGRAAPLETRGWVNAQEADSFGQGIVLGSEQFRPVSGIEGYSITTDGSDPDESVEATAANPNGDATYAIPHPLSEGVTTIRARAVSGAGVPSSEVGLTLVRVDRTAPETSVEGAPEPQQWQRRPVTLTLKGTDQLGLSGMNGSDGGAPIEDGAFIAYRLDGGQEQRAKGGSVSIPVAEDGRHIVSYRAYDLAGNPSVERQAELRIDTTAPETVVFEEQDPDHPLRVAVAVGDRSSGIAAGAVEMRRRGAGHFEPLDTRLEGDRLYATIDDRDLPEGIYELRARAWDVAGNEAISDRGRDGSKFRLIAPFRIATKLALSAPRELAARRVSRRCRRGKRCPTRYRRRARSSRAAKRSASSSTVAFGRAALVRGRLTSTAGASIAGRSIEVQARLNSTGARFRRVGTVSTDAAGRFSYVAPKGASRTLRFVFHGTETLQPAVGDVRLAVSGSSTLSVDRRRVRNGQSIRFAGKVPQPVTDGLKLIDLQAFYRGKWRTFATPRADARGRWRFRYRFEVTTGRVVYRFRVRIRREAAYPYELGYSKTVAVTVTGR